LSVATGKAKIPDLNQPSKLKVSFFWFFYADYFVMDKL
jgi:lipocalin